VQRHHIILLSSQLRPTEHYVAGVGFPTEQQNDTG